MKTDEMTKVFEGYTPTRKHCEFYLSKNGALYIKYTLSGVLRKFNDEQYYEDSDIWHMLTMAGYSAQY